MIRLSVNVNKVATLRNSRGGHAPDVIEAVEVCLAAGVPGITVHPRADRRHITPGDVREIARVLAGRGVEFNIEGDPRPELIDLVDEVRPDQCTLVPVAAGEITSQAGWQPGRQTDGVEGRHCRVQVPRRSRQRLRRSRAGADRVGGCRPAPTASSSTPSRSRVRSRRARPPAGRRSSRSPRGAAGRIARPRGQRRPRSRPGQPHAIPAFAVPRRGVDRPRDHLARALCRPRYGRARVPRCSVGRLI